MRLDLSDRLGREGPAHAGGAPASLSAFFPVHDEEDNVVPMAEAVLAVLRTSRTAGS
jgi:hypothetical protein